MGAMPHEPHKQNPRQSRLPEVLFFHGRQRGMRKPIAENRQIHIGVIACPKNERYLAFAAKLPELEIFQVNVERLHARDEQAGEAFAIATTQEENL